MSRADHVMRVDGFIRYCLDKFAIMYNYFLLKNKTFSPLLLISLNWSCTLLLYK